MSGAGPTFLHANAVALGEKGLLLRGPSGCGKSALSLALIARCRAQGDFARLVGDDRVMIEAVNGRIIARPHPAIHGKMEVRGLGLVALDYEPACAIDAIVDLCAPGETPARYPEEAAKSAVLLGVALPRLATPDCGDVSVERIAFFIQRMTTF